MASRSWAPLYGLDGLTLGERLRRARKRLGLQSQEVAASIECPLAQMSRWENDTTIPMLPNFAALAARYQVPMEALFWGPLPEAQS